MKIGDKVKILNLENLTIDNVQTVRNNNFICIISNIRLFPVGNDMIDIIFLEGLSTFFLTDELELIDP